MLMLSALMREHQHLEKKEHGKRRCLSSNVLSALMQEQPARNKKENGGACLSNADAVCTDAGADC